MSVRRATQCLGKLPDKSSRSGRSLNPASPVWPGKLSIPSSPLRWHDERETSKLIQASDPAQPSERLFRSRENVKAWLESSPTSVLDDHHLDGDISAHSSLESFNSTPVGSPFHRSVTSSRFLSPCPSVSRQQAGLLSPCSATHQLGHVRVRAISPPRCPPSNRTATDVSRIDAAQSTYFLSLAYKNAQNRGTSTPPAALGASFRDEVEESCDSPRSDFSLTSEWQNMLAAGNAAGMSTRDCDSSAHYHSEYDESSYDASNAMFRAHRAHAQVMRPEPCRIRSMELPKVSHVHDHDLPQRHSAPQQFERRRTVNYDHGVSCPDTNDLHTMSGRISERSRSIEEAFTQRMQHRAAATWAITKQDEVREVKRASFLEKMQNDIAMAFRKPSEEKKAIAEAKRAEKLARAAAAEPKLTRRRSSKSPRGCLFLG